MMSNYLNLIWFPFGVYLSVDALIIYYN
jgi:hypothetical protein